MKLSSSAVALAATHAVAALTSESKDCRCVPTDSCWPDPGAWDILNSLVGGRLIPTQPVGRVCHNPTYDEAKCKEVRERWDNSPWLSSIPEAIMSPSFANNSCNPFGRRQDPCTVGGYAQYSILIEKPSDIARGVEFAREHNIRLVVKNTGHDYLGRSVGYGSLSLWTHHLKSMEYVPEYKGTHSQSHNSTKPAYYTGPAIKVGAGVQVLEAYEFAHKHGYMLVGGECSSVGLSGGYTAGGGQSPLSSFAGLAADQTLEFEVVLANGTLITASQSENPDLYWALSGGGPGYGVVYSVTYKLYKDLPITGTKLSFSSGDDADAFWEAINTWHAMTPQITDLGGYTYTNLDSSSFNLAPLFVPNRTHDEVLGLLSPFHDKLNSLGIDYSSNTTTYSNYLDAWKALVNDESSTNSPEETEEPESGSSAQDTHQSTRLIPRKTFLDDSASLTRTLRSIAEEGAWLLEMDIGATQSAAGNPDNAVNNAWRTANMLLFIGDNNNTSTSAGINDKVTKVWGGRIRDLTPGSGTYMNEADVYEPNFQQAFYGNKYGRLRQIKEKYDPDSLFYATTAVGSDEWVRQEDGRLCRF